MASSFPNVEAAKRRQVAIVLVFSLAFCGLVALGAMLLIRALAS